MATRATEHIAVERLGSTQVRTWCSGVCVYTNEMPNLTSNLYLNTKGLLLSDLHGPTLCAPSVMADMNGAHSRP